MSAAWVFAIEAAGIVAVCVFVPTPAQMQRWRQRRRDQREMRAHEALGRGVAR